MNLSVVNASVSHGESASHPLKFNARACRANSSARSGASHATVSSNSLRTEPSRTGLSEFDIATREGITMVFDKSSGLVYAPASLDLTNELIRNYNSKYKAQAKAPAKGKK